MAVVLPFSPVPAPSATLRPKRRWLGEILVEAGALDGATLAEALAVTLRDVSLSGGRLLYGTAAVAPERAVAH